MRALPLYGILPAKGVPMSYIHCERCGYCKEDILESTQRAHLRKAHGITRTFRGYEAEDELIEWLAEEFIRHDAAMDDPKCDNDLYV